MIKQYTCTSTSYKGVKLLWIYLADKCVRHDTARRCKPIRHLGKRKWRRLYSHYPYLYFMYNLLVEIIVSKYSINRDTRPRATSYNILLHSLVRSNLVTSQTGRGDNNNNNATERQINDRPTGTNYYNIIYIIRL